MVLEKNAKAVLNELKNLNLMDRFLFAEATEDSEVLEIILEIVLGKEVVLKYRPQAEKEIRKAAWSKIVRLDVMGADIEGSVYNAEVQKKNTGDIPRRSRFYNGMIDSKLLPSGSVDYNELSDVFIITIMAFDLFGEGKYRYTFEMTCEESRKLKLNDGATYATAKALDNEKIWKLYEKINVIKQSEEIGVKWMNAWEERIYMEREARAKGLAEGRAEGHAEGHAEGRAEGRFDAMMESIKNLMESLSLSQEQAMDALKIPEEEREGLIVGLR